MKEIILDFTKCKNANSIDELYQIIKEKVPYYFDYGNNPSALWDVMRDYWENDESVHFKIYGVNALEYLYLQMEMEYIINVFQRIYRNNPNVTFEIVS